MKFLLLIATVICLVKGEDVEIAFQRAMTKYAAKNIKNKLRESPEMKNKRYSSFAKFHAMVEEVNNDDSLPYRAADNFMSILTEEERRSYYGLNITRQLADTNTADHDFADNVLPTSDSVIPEQRDFSLVISDIKDQDTCGACHDWMGTCGSSWAFAATGAIEGEIYFKTGNKKVSLSEQECMECSNTDKWFEFKYDGCRGGKPDYVYTYAMKYDRLAPSRVYVYQKPANDRGICYASDTTSNALLDNNVKVTGIIRLKASNNDIALLQEASTHIISVWIYANHRFQGYKGGVYVDAGCNNNMMLNHAVDVVGYGKDSSSGHKYWKIRNSWGRHWGEKGYMLMDRERPNMCRISARPEYPKVECRNGNCVAPNPNDGDSSDDEKDKDDEDEDKNDAEDKKFGYDEACFIKRHMGLCKSKMTLAQSECTKGGVPSSECITAKINKNCYVGTTGDDSDLRYIETSYKCSNESQTVRNSNSDGIQLPRNDICYGKNTLTKVCLNTREEALEVCKAKVTAKRCIIMFTGKCFLATNGWDNGGKFVRTPFICKKDGVCEGFDMVVCKDCICCKPKSKCSDY